MSALTFPDQHTFNQAAFITVAHIVAAYGEEIIVSGSSSPNTEQCLEQLMRVCSTWGYDSSDISTLHELFAEENQRISDYEKEIGVNHD
ncbi:hypothetical protein [Aquirhabdus parva]|uniref:hypothetical protein n=1 Tax=Aquirhabdus parva TaxID=2283318 RepID=UPI0013B3C574|nr:hypothetical protein [Aquirhabdus parva]